MQRKQRYVTTREALAGLCFQCWQYARTQYGWLVFAGAMKLRNLTTKIAAHGYRQIEAGQSDLDDHIGCG